MNIIISGVTSFIGRETAAQLLAAGHTVIGIVRPGSRNAEGLREAVLAAMSAKAGNFQIVRFDFDDLPDADEAVYKNAASAALTSSGVDKRCSADADVWIHFAWDGVGSAGRSDPAVQEKNIRNAKKAYTMAEALGCRRFLFAGSQAEYGGGTKEHPKPVSEYGKAKLAFGKWGLAQAADSEHVRAVNAQTAAPKYVRTAYAHTADKQPMQFIHMRIYSVYGVGDHETSLVNTCVRAMLAGKDMQLGPCTQQWNYMEIRDCAAAICPLACDSRAESGVYDVAGEEVKPLRTYVEEIRRLCGGNGRLLFGTRADNAEGAKDLQPDIRKLKALGFQEQVQFSEGIRRIAEMVSGMR